MKRSSKPCWRLAAVILWMSGRGAAWLSGAESSLPSLLSRVNLSESGCPPPSPLAFDSEFSGTRHAIFAGEDRVIVSYAGLPSGNDGKNLVTPVCALAINVSDGRVQEPRQQTVPIYQDPMIFPTATGQFLLVTGGAVLLNSDLTETGLRLDVPGGCRILHVSPDGTVVAIEGNSRTRLFDTRTLQATGVNLEGGGPSTITATASATNDTWPIDRKPGQQFAYVATMQGARPVLLRKCHTGFQVDFLSEGLMLITCGDSYQVQDQEGHVLADARFFAKHVRFGGVSLDGKRFAVVISGRSFFDPWPVSSQELKVFEVGRTKAIATVPIQHPTEGTWSALSPSGHRLVIGSPDGVRLWRLP